MTLGAQFTKLALGATLWLAACTVSAEMVVVVSRDSDVEALSRSQVAEIFTGRMLRLPNGTRVKPIDLPEDSSARKEFYMKLLGKSPAQMKAYWSRIIFTGKGLPPKEAANSKEANKMVAGNAGFIGYLPKGMKDSRVKTVLIVD